MRMCMGGWCDKREACQRYAPGSGRVAEERVCERGQHDAFIPNDVRLRLDALGRKVEPSPFQTWTPS